MSNDELDRMLSREENIVPSSGFVPKVMGAVRREASIPAPIPFPWRSAAPGLAIGGVGLIAFLIIVAIQLGHGNKVMEGPMPRVFAAIAEQANSLGLAWISLALLASFVPMLIIRGRTVPR
jgi:hypothetical protein